LSVYRGRRAVTIENRDLRVTVLACGGHVAEVFDKQTGVNPLWTPHWDSVEPTSYDRAQQAKFGDGSDAKLLAGVMGHNICLDLFGGPQIRFSRHIALRERSVRFRESVENDCRFDRPIGWTQHVTLGPPFLEKGMTEFRTSATRSKVFEDVFGPADFLESGAEFVWPHAPLAAGGFADFSLFTDATASSAYTAHLMNPDQENAFFVAFSPMHKLALSYVWKSRDFPWLGIWQENHSRTHVPWKGEELTCGMEFGMSPFPESRLAMVQRSTLFGARTFGWLPAQSRLDVEYWAVTAPANKIPENVVWPD